MGMAGNVVWLKDHVRVSSATTKAGRSTSEGHEASSGQRSENQRITSSYLRAVKVLPSSSKRSKKRQSPAAKRPSVAMLTEREAAYAEAQAMRLDRSSVSMTEENSRKIPTLQANSVGNFRLAENSDTSDKSAMSSVDEVRHRIQQAFDRTGESPITLALLWEFERNHIRDFLEGKKDSLKPEILQNISEHYGIPLNMLIIKRQRKKRKAAA
jgi:hypothetical protein